MAEECVCDIVELTFVHEISLQSGAFVPTSSFVDGRVWWWSFEETRPPVSRQVCSGGRWCLGQPAGKIGALCPGSARVGTTGTSGTGPKALQGGRLAWLGREGCVVACIHKHTPMHPYLCSVVWPSVKLVLGIALSFSGRRLKTIRSLWRL